MKNKNIINKSHFSFCTQGKVRNKIYLKPHDYEWFSGKLKKTCKGKILLIPQLELLVIFFVGVRGTEQEIPLCLKLITGSLSKSEELANRIFNWRPDGIIQRRGKNPLLPALFHSQNGQKDEKSDKPVVSN